MASHESTVPESPKPRQSTAVRISPDHRLLTHLLQSGGEDLKKCMQCATCSAVCELSRDEAPFPRKEMLWAQWGLGDRLMSDVDLWLCHQCHDCTRRCPRGARPGDVMAALRRECIYHHAVPRGLARWVDRPWSLVLLLGGAIGVLGAAVLGWQAFGFTAAELGALGDDGGTARIVYPFWTRLPHGLIVALFTLVAALDLAILGVGARRLWHAFEVTRVSRDPHGTWRGLGSSLRAAASRILWHDDFASCGATRARGVSHALLVYGMAALFVVDLWVVTARYNPLLAGLAYPLAFLNPWKILANLGGLAVLMGCLLMMTDRLRRPGGASEGTQSDWSLLVLLVLVVLTGFASEALHFARIEPLRWMVYGVHLASVLVLLVVLPYSKLAHVVYRAVALVHAERSGRTLRPESFHSRGNAGQGRLAGTLEGPGLSPPTSRSSAGPAV